VPVVAHVGPFPVEELLGGCSIAVAIGIPTLRAMAKAKLSRSSRNRSDQDPG
jgi:hypothetical protein